MSRLLLQGDCRRIPLADQSVHCVVTSPPFWNLRDYKTGRWEGGDPSCDHSIKVAHGPKRNGECQNGHASTADKLNRQRCRCGAVRIDRQIGLEPSPAAYIDAIVAVFREVRRVIFERDHGICAACQVDTRQFDLKWLEVELYLTRRAMLTAPDVWRRWKPAPTLDERGGLWPPPHWLYLIDQAAAWRARHKIGLNRSPWEADHITPIIEGGDFFDMANLRTLCVPCHKIETAKLAGRRAERRGSRA